MKIYVLLHFEHKYNFAVIIKHHRATPLWLVALWTNLTWQYLNFKSLLFIKSVCGSKFARYVLTHHQNFSHLDYLFKFLGCLPLYTNSLLLCMTTYEIRLLYTNSLLCYGGTGLKMMRLFRNSSGNKISCSLLMILSLQFSCRQIVI